MSSIIVEPIAHVRAARRLANDDYWGNEMAQIHLSPSVSSEALRGLESFSHVEVLLSFTRSPPADVVAGARHPRGNPEWPLVGIFAQRGKNRPTRIGSTICRVVRVEGDVLTVAELEAIDGTPVLDIKPVMQEFLPRQPVRQPSWSRELMSLYWLVKQPDGEA